VAWEQALLAAGEYGKLPPNEMMHLLVGLGWIYLDGGQIHKALPLFSQAIELDPDDSLRMGWASCSAFMGASTGTRNPCATGRDLCLDSEGARRGLHRQRDTCRCAPGARQGRISWRDIKEYHSMTSHPRVAFLIRGHPSIDPGGAEVQAWMIAVELTRRGWDIHWLCEWPRTQTVPDMLQGVHLHPLPVRKEELALLNWRPVHCILHQIGAEVYYQRAALPYTGILGIPPHTPRRFVWGVAETIYCREGWKAFLRAWKRDPRHDSKRVVRGAFAVLNGLAFEAGARRAAALVAQTGEQRKYIAERWKRDAMVIRNGFTVSQLPVIKSHPPVVLWVGRFSQGKNPLAFLQLAADCIGLDASFMMVGQWVAPSESELGKKAKMYLERLPNVTYCGEKSVAETERLIGEAAIVVNTSLAQGTEGFPNVLLQSWFNRTTTVTLQVDPDRLFSKRGIGLLAGSQQGLANAVRRLLADDATRESIADGAYQFATENHSMERIATAYEGVFTEVASSGRM